MSMNASPIPLYSLPLRVTAHPRSNGSARVIQPSNPISHDVAPKLLANAVLILTVTRLTCFPPSMSYFTHANRHLDNILKHAKLNAVVSVADRAAILSAADKLGAPSDVSLRRSPHGRIVLVKDNICTTELPTTAASGILKGFKSPYDATVVKQLRAAGALIAGKTNMDEFGMGSYGLHSYHGPTRMSRIDGKEASAGGSSGGSALAVATDQCWA